MTRKIVVDSNRRAKNITVWDDFLPYEFKMFTDYPDSMNEWIIANLQDSWYSWSMKTKERDNTIFQYEFFPSFASKEDAALFTLFWNPSVREDEYAKFKTISNYR